MRNRGVLVVLCGVFGLGGACGFNPSGGELGDDGDDGNGELDGASGDGPNVTVDAPAVAVDAPIDAGTPCPADYTVAIGGARYVRRGQPRGIDVARADCADDLAGRTRLATFETAGDLDAVLNAVGLNEDHLWVGARCQFDVLGCAGPSSWTWDTGTGVSASLWVAPEPDNPFTETNAIAAKRVGGGGWGMWTVGGIFPLEGRRYVCECSE